MIRIIVLYFAIGLLLITNLAWNEVNRLCEEEHFSKPLMVITVIGSSFVTPIVYLAALVLGLIDSFRSN